MLNLFLRPFRFERERPCGLEISDRRESRFTETLCLFVVERSLSVARWSGNSMSMNPRHAAALALVGWHLMVPPHRYFHGQALVVGTDDTKHVEGHLEEGLREASCGVRFRLFRDCLAGLNFGVVC
jgi:hypothetical protein